MYELLKSMKEKKDEHLAVLQGFDQTYADAVKRYSKKIYRILSRERQYVFP